jgi:hypothetical protein
VHGVRGRSALEWRAVRVGADGPRVLHRQFIFHGALLDVRLPILDGPSPTRGRSARSIRMVHQVHYRLPKSLAC